MKEENKIYAINGFGALITIALFWYNYVICGKTFGMCISLFYAYVTLFLTSFVIGIISTKNDRKMFSGLKGVLSMPISALVIVLLLEPEKITNTYNIAFQFMLLIPGLLSGLITYGVIRRKSK